MSTSTLHIALPDELRSLVDERVRSGDFVSHSAYIESLVRQDQHRLTRERLEASLLERVEAADAVEVNADDFNRMREEFHRRRLARTGR